jgi:hypothetical protein
LRSFRSAAGWAAPRIIHWWLIAFTAQNYGFPFGCNNIPEKNIFCRDFRERILAVKPVNTTRFAAFYQRENFSGFFNCLRPKR